MFSGFFACQGLLQNPLFEFCGINLIYFVVSWRPRDFRSGRSCPTRIFPSFEGRSNAPRRHLSAGSSCCYRVPARATSEVATGCRRAKEEASMMSCSRFPALLQQRIILHNKIPILYQTDLLDTSTSPMMQASPVVEYHFHLRSSSAA
jgi:hypothetical protein